jgi:hypothetical protein
MAVESSVFAGIAPSGLYRNSGDFQIQSFGLDLEIQAEQNENCRLFSRLLDKWAKQGYSIYVDAGVSFAGLMQLGWKAQPPVAQQCCLGRWQGTTRRHGGQHDRASSSILRQLRKYRLDKDHWEREVMLSADWRARYSDTS